MKVLEAPHDTNVDFALPAVAEAIVDVPAVTMSCLEVASAPVVPISQICMLRRQYQL